MSRYVWKGNKKVGYRHVLAGALLLTLSLWVGGCGNTTSSPQTPKPSSASEQQNNPSSGNATTIPPANSAGDHAAGASLTAESMISASQLDAGIKEKKNFVIVDVREPNEYASGHVPTAINIPLGNLDKSLNQLPKDKEIILVCLNGARSFTAWQNLTSKGYDKHQVKVLVGGMEQWKSLGSGEVTDSIGGC